jgi:hypothetical protein
MLTVTCPDVKTARGETLVSERRVVRMVDDGAGVITLTVLCHSGHLHEVVTGRGAVVTPLPARAPALEAVAC